MTQLLINWLSRLRNWQLHALIVGITVLVAETVVVLVELGLYHQTTRQTLTIGTVASLIIASVMVVAVMGLRRRLDEQAQQHLNQAYARTTSHLAISLEAARMLFWEADLRAGALYYDVGRLNWLGLSEDETLATLSGWMARIHPDDLGDFRARYAQTLEPNGPDFGCEYRMKRSDGGWTWLHTWARVKERAPDGTALLAVGGTVNIDDRKRAEVALRETHERFNIIFNRHPEVMLISRLTDGTITEVNDAFEVSTGFTRHEAIGKTTLQLGVWSNPADRQIMVQALTAHGRCDGLETEFITRWGEPIASQLDAVATPIQGLPHIVCVVRDIRPRRRAEQAQTALTAQLQASNALLASLMEDVPIPVFYKDEQGRYLGFNRAYEELMGRGRDTLMGRTVFDITPPDLARTYHAQDLALMRDHGVQSYETQVQNGSGERRDVMFNKACFFDAEGNVKGLIGCLVDITDRKRAERQIWRQANYDALTELPNRRMFMDRLAHALTKAARDGVRLALLFVDLDRFKDVNDGLGHAAGDALLRQAAQRIASCARKSDTVARIGGDEFTVTLTDVAERGSAARIANSILDAMAQPFDLNGSTAHVSTSIGVALFPDDATDLDTLLNRADQAMYAAKAAGRNTVRYAE